MGLYFCIVKRKVNDIIVLADVSVILTKQSDGRIPPSLRPSPCARFSDEPSARFFTFVQNDKRSKTNNGIINKLTIAVL